MASSSSLQHAFIFILLGGLKALALDKFTAAVYEHVVIQPEATTKPVSPEQALKLMNQNIDIYEDAIQKAAKQGAHIIVTPEDGIYGFFFTRETIYPYLEDIPDPQVNWIPCTDPKRFGPAPVQKRLSCLARNNTIYVVANMGDKKECSNEDSTCPGDGHYQYNTDVVFDPEGKLVARYHKFNLFQLEHQFDFPKEPELVTFNTSFGKFGLFTCFDILFHDPAVALVSQLSVDTILFPTAWMNVLPHLTAIEFHSAWAMGMRVNVLAANTHNTSLTMTGSGIYTPSGSQAYHYDDKLMNGHLLVAEIYSHPSHFPTPLPTVNWSLYATTIDQFHEYPTFTEFLFHDPFTFSKLTKQADNITVCQNSLCCHLSYRMREEPVLEDELYVLGAFDDLHVVEGQYYLQICTLLKCEGTHIQTCGKPVTTADSIFELYSLSGTFSTNYVFPEVLLSGIRLAPGGFRVLRDGRLISQNNISQALLTVTLFGRWYEEDSPSKPTVPNKVESTTQQISCLILLLFQLSFIVA
ncbi:pantetheinase isoform X1 [Protobothrops mucrosquamatus]|uniref:pantetheinase isoform X1 n=1 Tax=Protobothrops mucrosquamatus TaxID=103944 RepID=UPI0007758B35|nr:pantetheinase isoform X1 [Protobothrops mucrosquamatus]